jgi:hypothetical protein
MAHTGAVLYVCVSCMCNGKGVRVRLQSPYFATFRERKHAYTECALDVQPRSGFDNYFFSSVLFLFLPLGGLNRRESPCILMRCIFSYTLYDIDFPYTAARVSRQVWIMRETLKEMCIMCCGCRLKTNKSVTRKYLTSMMNFLVKLERCLFTHRCWYSHRRDL